MSHPNQPPYQGNDGQYPGHVPGGPSSGHSSQWQGGYGHPGQQGHGAPGPQGGYGGPGQPGGQYYQQQPQTKGGAGKVLIVVGSIVLVVSVVLALVLGAGLGGAVPGDDEITRVDGTATVTVEDEEGLVLYRPEGQEANCRVLGPGGITPDVDMGGVTYSFTYQDEQQASFARVGGGDNPEGEYQVACQEGGVIVAPPVSAAGILGGVGGILIGVFGGTLGVILLIIGIVLTASRRRR